MAPEISTRALVDRLADRDPAHGYTIGELLDEFRTRAFGLFLLLALLPAFIPLPVGMGAVSGPLVSLIGLQLLLRLPHPWLPGRLARHPVKPERFTRFRARASRWLQRLEKISRPRAEAIVDHAAARLFTGLLLLILGVLLSLPIPLTNYPFGLILLLYAIALIERDGRMMLLAWLLGLAEIIAFALFSQQIATWIAAWWA
ncbi:MAG TPA: exopolysaccharide biosynthesis protein [Arenimonas sp.]|nr:exopolysaccharide biosynthesis protein [Arenimonas sp.]